MPVGPAPRVPAATAGEALDRERRGLRGAAEGRRHFSQFPPKGAERALACFRCPLSLEPDYPDALVMHALYHVMSACMFAQARGDAKMRSLHATDGQSAPKSSMSTGKELSGQRLVEGTGPSRSAATDRRLRPAP